MSGGLQTSVASGLVRTAEAALEQVLISRYSTLGKVKAPFLLRSDNDQENVSGKLIAWAEQNHIRMEYIQPGKPQQNAYIERFNRTVRYEWLSQYFWEDLSSVTGSTAVTAY